jgi:uncharacterized coiled-coil protein SlyX
MSYQSARKSRLQARKTSLESQIATLENTLDGLLSSEVEEYRFDDGEGAQRVKRRKFKEVQDQLDSLESRLDAVCRELAGLGLVVSRLRRKRYHGHTYHGGRF